jgi:hypothetical protein
MQEAAPAKRFQQEMSQAMAPIENLMRARGVTPAQVMSSYANYDRMLSDPSTSAMAAAQLLRSYNINIEHLAHALDGAQSPQQGAQSQTLDPNALVAQIKQQLKGEFQAERQQTLQQKLIRDVEAFASDPKNKYFEDVAPRMTALLNADQKLSIQDAYDQACWSHGEIRGILQNEASKQAAKAITASTQRAKGVASSVKSQPSTGASVVKVSKNHRDMVADLYDAAEV